MVESACTQSAGGPEPAVHGGKLPPEMNVEQQSKQQSEKVSEATDIAVVGGLQRGNSGSDIHTGCIDILTLPIEHGGLPRRYACWTRPYVDWPDGCTAR